MARPRLGESDSKRLQMVITEDELKAIDEWRFANKIENRSEAIRRLCQVGIEVDSDLDEATDLIDEALKLQRPTGMRCEKMFMRKQKKAIQMIHRSSFFVKEWVRRILYTSA